MTKDYVRAYPKYKQEAFNKISGVIMGLLNEVDFFKIYPWLLKDPRIFLYYDEVNFKREVEEANGGMARGFDVFMGGSHLLTLKSNEVHTIIKIREQLTEKEYSTVYKNLEVLHQCAGERGTMIESKIGRIVKYNIAKYDSGFVGQFGDTYREERRFSR